MPGPGQDGALVVASISPRSSSSTCIADKEKPGMSSAERNVPTHALSIATPLTSSQRMAALATMDNSIGGVDPSPFTTSTSRSPLTNGRSAAIVSNTSAVNSSAGASGIRRTPCSPRMPSPTLISPSARMKPGFPTAGSVQEPSEIPIDAMLSATRLASRATSSRGDFISAAAPATLRTRMVIRACDAHLVR